MLALGQLSRRLGITALLCCGAVSASGHSLMSAFDLELVARQGEVVDGQELDIFRGVALNNHGSVAYTAVGVDDTTVSPTGVALLVDGQLSAVTGDTIGNGVLGFLGEPDLADDGTVAYSADVVRSGDGLTSTGAVVGQGSDPLSHLLLAGRDTLINGVPLDGVINPSIDGTGSLAYTAIYYDSVLDLTAAAILHDGAVVATTGDLVGNDVVSTVDRPSINARGDLAFEASLIDLDSSEESTAIFLNGVLAASSGTTSDGIELMEVFSPSVNDHGDLAYIGRYLDRDQNLDNMAVFFNDEVVIESGDRSTEGLILDRILDLSINDSGQIALLATFIDEATGNFFEEGIFLSQVVPEPATGLGVVLAAMLAVTRRRHSPHAG